MTFEEFYNYLVYGTTSPKKILSFDYKGIPITEDVGQHRGNSPHMFPCAMDMAVDRSKTVIVKGGVIEGEIYTHIIIDDIYKDSDQSIEAMRERLFEKVAQAKLHNSINGFS